MKRIKELIESWGNANIDKLCNEYPEYEESIYGPIEDILNKCADELKTCLYLIEADEALKELKK